MHRFEQMLLSLLSLTVGPGSQSVPGRIGNLSQLALPSIHNPPGSPSQQSLLAIMPGTTRPTFESGRNGRPQLPKFDEQHTLAQYRNLMTAYFEELWGALYTYTSFSFD
jgi:hypothetical protein